MSIASDDVDRLMKAALRAREGAYAPYSGYAVGAAVLTEAGNVYAGANVENSSYGLTMCAERVAIGAAVTAGDSDIRALLLLGGDIENPNVYKRITPCGACRQVIAEFMPDDGVVISAALNGTYDTYIFKNLLPKAFKLEDY
jgi:cytidine deaminase